MGLSMSEIIVLPEKLSASEFAHHIGVCKQTVSNWMKKGMPHRRLSPRIVRIDPNLALKWLEQNSNSYLK